MIIIKLLRRNLIYFCSILIVGLLFSRIVQRGIINLTYITLADLAFQGEKPNELEIGVIVHAYNNIKDLSFISLQSGFQKDAFLFILSQEGLSNRVVSEFEQSPTFNNIKHPIINDAIVWSYLNEFFKGETVNNNYLSSASKLRPYDICVNYQMRNHALIQNDVNAVNKYTKLLKKFPIQAIQPADDRLLNCLVSVIPLLRSENIWSLATTQRVTSFLVWQFPQQEALGSLLETFIIDYPNEPYWRFYLGEYYQRQSEWLQAINTYQDYLQYEPRAYLRLGIVTEAWAKTYPDKLLSEKYERQALKHYQTYNGFFPNDSFAAQRIVRLKNKIDSQDSFVSNLDTVNACTITEPMHLDTNFVLSGQNLVEDPFFEQPLNDIESQWRIGVYEGENSEDGLYFIDNRNLIESTKGIRLLAIQAENYADGKRTYAEVTGTPFSVDNEQYLVQIEYLTSNFISGSGFLLLSDFSLTQPFELLKTNLPDTHGQWHTLCFLVDGPTNLTKLKPLIRNWGDGDLQIRYLEVTPSTK